MNLDLLIFNCYMLSLINIQFNSYESKQYFQLPVRYFYSYYLIIITFNLYLLLLTIRSSSLIDPLFYAKFLARHLLNTFKPSKILKRYCCLQIGPNEVIFPVIEYYQNNIVNNKYFVTLNSGHSMCRKLSYLVRLRWRGPLQ